MNFSPPDKVYMQRALELAKRGLGWTNPNPLVGAVLVKKGKVIGEGCHHRVGMAHGEIDAINSVKGKDVRGATLYLNLEPCSHYGRMPPCADAVIAAGIKRVVCSTIDPSAKVQGKGIKKIKAAAINVELGLFADEAVKLNEAFFTFHQKHRPFIVAKFAASLDGKVAARMSDSKWITNESLRAYSRRLRGQYQAILVGINTVLRDNPHLGAPKTMRDPLRIILDSHLKIPLASKVLRDKNVLVVTSSSANKQKIKKLLKAGYEIVKTTGQRVSLPQLLRALVKREIVSIFVEGGGEVHGAFFDAQLVDKVYACYAPIIIGGAGAKSAVAGLGISKVMAAPRLKNVSIKKFGDNFLVTGYPEYVHRHH